MLEEEHLSEGRVTLEETGWWQGHAGECSALSSLARAPAQGPLGCGQGRGGTPALWIVDICSIFCSWKTGVSSLVGLWALLLASDWGDFLECAFQRYLCPSPAVYPPLPPPLSLLADRASARKLLVKGEVTKNLEKQQVTISEFICHAPAALPCPSCSSSVAPAN